MTINDRPAEHTRCLGIEVESVKVCTASPEPARGAKLARRIDDHTTRRSNNPLKTNAQGQSQSQIPVTAVLSSHGAVRSAPPAVRRSAGQAAGSLTTEFLCPQDRPPPSILAASENFPHWRPDAQQTLKLHENAQTTRWSRASHLLSASWAVFVKLGNRPAWQTTSHSKHRCNAMQHNAEHF